MTLQKINKAQARKLYNAGKRVLMVPSNQYPYSSPTMINMCNESGKDFDRAVTGFVGACCKGSRMGYYAAFYVEV